MGNFEDAEKAYVTALLSEGSALKENEAYMQSIEAHQAQLKAQWEQLVLSAPFEDLEKILLKLSTTILKFANSDIGQLTIKITAIVAVLGGMTILLAKIPPMIVAWSISVMGLNEALTTTELVFGALNTTMLASPLFWGTVAVAAIVGIVAVVKKLTHALEEQREVLEDANDAYDEAQGEIETLKGKLSVLDEELAKLYKQKIQLTDQEDLNRLSQQTKELKEQERSYKIQLQLAEAKAQAAEREAIAAAKRIKTTQTTAKVQGTNVHTNKEETIFTATGTQQEVFGKAVKEMAQLDIQIKKNEESIAALTEKYGENSSQVGVVVAQNEELQQKLWDLQDGSIGYADSLNEVITRLGDFNVTIDGQTYSVQHLLDVYTNMTETGDDVANTNRDIADSTDESEESAEDAADAWSSFLDSLEDIQTAYETLDKAAKEYNENGLITAATLKKLNKLEPQYLEALQLEGDQYQVNVNLLKTLYETEKAEAIAKLELAKNTSLINLANEYLSESTQAVDTDIGNCAQEAKDAAPNYDELAKHAGEAAIKLREVHDYLVGGAGDDSARWEEFKQKWQETTDFYDKQIENVKASDIGLVDSAKSAAGGHKDAWVEAFEEEQRQLKHALEMNEITEIEYYQKLKDLNEKYFGEISGNHQKYIKEYQENEEEIYKGMKAIYDKVADYLREAIEQGYEDAINALKKEEKKVLAEIKAQIEALKDEKKKVLDDIQNQIDGLKKKKDKVQDYWNSQIDKIKESNSELQKQNELLEKQQALQRAKAQKVMVMKDGKFQLGENESAVAQAEQNLAQYQDQMSYEQQISEMEKLRDKQVETIDDRIEKLEEYKDYMEDYYDEQIDALEKYYDQVEKQYEEQIEALQEQLDAFKKHAEEQKKIEEARLAAQLLGIEKESDLFEISLANLEDYVAKYNALVASMEVPSVFADGLNLPISGSAPSGGGVGKGATITKHASGAANIRSNEIALVGESPNAELVVGSHLNRSMGGGTLLNLSKGSGVVNAESTATLAGLLNGVVTPTNVSNSRSTMQTFTFGNLTLPNVTDAESFVNTLSHKFNNYAIQYGNSRK